MYLVGSGVNDPRRLEKIIEHPPTSRQTLEYWFGKDASGVVAEFGFADMVTAFSCDLDVGYVTVAQLLERTYGAGRPIATGQGQILEYGMWFYLRLRDDGSAHLAWAHERPLWALPPVQPDAREYLLVTLLDRMVCDTTIEPLWAALEPLAGPAGAELLRWDAGELVVRFRPGLALAAVTRTFRWEEPVATSGSVHLSSWQVHPRHAPPQVGSWALEVQLEGWPRGPERSDLPQLGRSGPSPVYDVRTTVTPVHALVVQPVRSR